jgi:hypothetical protein
MLGFIAFNLQDNVLSPIHNNKKPWPIYLTMAFFKD